MLVSQGARDSSIINLLHRTATNLQNEQACIGFFPSVFHVWVTILAYDGSICNKLQS